MKPLAERMRPTTLSNYIGQAHLLGQEGVLKNMIKTKRISSFILWGPPGVGKTTLAQIIANEVKVPFYTLSAVSSGVKDVREVIKSAKQNLFFNEQSPILFIDEIHRFSKSQQDSLLAAVEQGIITLIGATTENPSFEVIRPLLSRCQIYILKSLTKDELELLIKQAVTHDIYLKKYHIILEELDTLILYSGGDARKLLNFFELIIADITAKHPDQNEIIITNSIVETCIQINPLAYDKEGDIHYDIVSAFIKSIRGGDPNAAIYWLARMIAGGEDPKFIARRLVISAAEDIGLANPNALLLANATFDAVDKIGFPEARIPLAETTIYLASSPKSNSAYSAINAAIDFVTKTGNLPVPLHLKNAPTPLMKELGYGDNYLYPHDYSGHFIKQDYFPLEAKNASFWKPAENKQELILSDRLKKWWKKS